MASPGLPPLFLHNVADYVSTMPTGGRRPARRLTVAAVQGKRHA